MSAVANHASGVEMMIFRRHLVVVRLAVSVEVMLGNSNKLPPTVTRTRYVSTLLGRSEAASWRYDIAWSVGTADCLTKNMVFMPFFKWVLTPCAERPRSFARAFVHVFLSGPQTRFLYSSMLPVTGSIAEFQKCVARGMIGALLTTTLLACCNGLEISSGSI